MHDSDSEDDTIGEAIKKLATKGEQMASFMERMQDSQGQQIQLMSQLVGCFNKYVENNKKEWTEWTVWIMNSTHKLLFCYC